MKLTLEHALNHWVLLAVNILILILVEITGSFFANTGLIHLLALFFVAIGLTRIWTHRDVYDRFLEPVIHSGILALLILAFSHIVEYFSFRTLNLTHQSISANVVNAYMVSFLIITVGTESFLKGLYAKSKIIIILAAAASLVFSGLFVLFLTSPQLIQLHPSSPHLYLYLAFTLLISIFCIWRLNVLGQHVPLMKNFVHYFIAAIVLICIVAIQSILEEIITSLGVPFLQIVYINHFLFYGALSLMFLSYERLMHLEGIYKDLDKT